MGVEYDIYYQTENLFGDPYPELISFYSNVKVKGSLLDLGCGQGRDAIPLAKLGYKVTGIDHSQVGIDQLNQIAERDSLSLTGEVADVYTYSKIDQFDFILLDSMFHFGKREKEKEVNFLNRIFDKTKSGAIITICIQKSGNKTEILQSIIENRTEITIIHQEELTYIYVDKESNHRSSSKYEMICLQKNLVNPRTGKSNMIYKIEKVGKENFEEIVEVWEASVRATHHFLKEEDILFFRPLILNEYLDAVDLRCIKNENMEIVGFAGTAAESLEMLFVHPDYRGKGVGKHLLLNSIEEFGVNKVDVNEENDQALGFYKAFGFKILGRSSEDALGKPYPILHMER